MWFSAAVACSSTIVAVRGQGLLYCWLSIVWKVESGPSPGLWRGMLHRIRGDLLFSFFKGFPALRAPITAPIHKKNRKLKWMVVEHIKVLLRAVMFTDDCCLRWRLLGRQPTWKILCSLWNPAWWFDLCTQLYTIIKSILQLCVLDDNL